MFTKDRLGNALRGAIAYAIAGWVLIQLSIAMEDALDIPDWVARWVTLTTIGAFPVVVLLVWLLNIPVGSKQGSGASLAEVTPAPLEPAAPRPAPAKQSIAVLPFVDMSPERDQSYFGEGVAEEILNALVKIKTLKVAGRTSSFQYKDQNQDITLIGQALNVAHVLEGSIRKQGDRVRITAQLIQSSDGYHLWSETYDGDLSDIFDLQDSISRSIVQELEVLLEGSAEQRLATNLTNNPQAYEYFLQGRQLVHQQSGQQTLPKAIDLLEKAVGLDPGFAEAWAWLADANYTLIENSLTPHWRDHLAAANQAVGRAEALDPGLPMVLHAAGYRASLENRLDKVIDAYQQGHDLDPSDPELRFSIGLALAGIGQIEEGNRRMDEVLSEQPLIAIFHLALANSRFALNRLEDAKRAYQRSIDMGNYLAAVPYAFLLAFEGHRKAAMGLLDKHMAQLPPTTLQLFKIPFSRFIFYTAVFRDLRPAAWMAIMSISMLVRMPFVQPTVAIPGAYFYLRAPRLFMRYFRKHSSIYTASTMILLWTPTEAARSIRTHKDFPQFAEDFGMVRAWQKYGWPEQIQPVAGTDGSNLQFVCS